MDQVPLDNKQGIVDGSRIHEMKTLPASEPLRASRLASMLDRPTIHRFSRRLAPGLAFVLLSVASGPALAERKAPPGKGGKPRNSGTTAPRANVVVSVTQFAQADQPIAFAMRADDPTMFVVEKAGRIRSLRDNVFDETAVLDITARVDSQNERGLIGLAFPPKRSDVLYINYTDKKGVVNISEVPFDGKRADINSERVLLKIPKPFNEHNAGTLSFDNEGLLYIAIGDGGGSGDPKGNAQRSDVLLGKILRIDPKPSAELPYSIPPSNPFARATLAGTRSARPEILALGLRNPWRASVDPTTGDIWVPDVGESDFEEINRIPKGSGALNFGWNLRQGKAQFKGPRPKGAVDPVFDYPHADNRCAVVGGGIYRGSKIVGLQGRYVFGDVCSGQLQVLDGTGPGKGTSADLGARVSYLTAFGTTNDGELIAMSLEGGLYRVEAA
jgi:glucose/arabinose dehydrogenase